MTVIHSGRFTAPPDRELAVFLLGMRINAAHRVGDWLPVFTAMPRMLRHLATHPEAGLLGYHAWFGRTTLLLSYWKDTESLQQFASASDAPHLAPWRAFTRKIGSSGTVGIWHETYRVTPGSYEVIYGNMPTFGLAAATGHIPVGPGLNTARQRLAAPSS